MKFLTALTLGAVLCSAGSAMADPVVAKLQAGLGAAQKPVAGGAVFECLGDICASRAPVSETASVRGCKDLARQVGAVTSFGTASKPLTPEQITSCNESARR